MHPFAGAIDTPLPATPHNVHIPLASKTNWVPVAMEQGDAAFDDDPDQSLEDWHRAKGLLDG